MSSVDPDKAREQKVPTFFSISVPSGFSEKAQTENQNEIRRVNQNLEIRRERSVARRNRRVAGQGGEAVFISGPAGYPRILNLVVPAFLKVYDYILGSFNPARSA